MTSTDESGTTTPPITVVGGRNTGRAYNQDRKNSAALEQRHRSKLKGTSSWPEEGGERRKAGSEKQK